MKIVQMAHLNCCKDTAYKISLVERIINGLTQPPFIIYISNHFAIVDE